MKKISYALIAILVIALIGCAPMAKDYAPQHLSGVVWGTTYNITYNIDEATDNEAISQAVTAALNNVGAIANAYDKTSEISRLNADGQLANPSAGFTYLLSRSRQVSHLTGGAFDPTVGPVVDLWGFGAGEAGKDITDADIKDALALVGIDNVLTDNTGVHFRHPGSRLDFAAIAKGYGVDCVANAITSEGIKNYMVEIGGEIRVAGVNPRGQAWHIQIDAPFATSEVTHNRLAVINLSDAAIATSGNYRNFKIDDGSGVLIGHTISPATGRPVTTDILSASIIAADATTADALATASMVMGLNEAVKLIERLASDPTTGVYGALYVTSGNADTPFLITSVNIPNAHASL